MFSAMILRAGLRASVTKPSDLPLTKAEAGEYLKNLWTLLEEFAVTYGGRLLIALLILIVGFRIVNILTKRVLHSKVVNRLEPSARTFLQSMVGILCKVLIGIIALSVMGVPMTSIITVVGSCGLAVGLALQGSLANIAGGFVLLVVKPFKVGHYITVGDISGTVTEMGIFNTKLLTYDNRVVIIPNSAISNATVINLTELPLRRVDLTFTASYGDDTAAVKKALLDVCDRHPLILKDPAPFAKVSGHKDSAIEYTMRAWCKTDDYWDVYYDLFEQVKKTFDERGITIPFPQMDVHKIDD
ncbi:MAG: mechanosensitive ion channel family protein [Clostridia bacterium]|nr:mechanosensitive ion channel family protein [Clostridia bacterium]MBR5424428.1 mechanosensitive ion channel family protein [Clostridia bacterium]